jgi:hypothetical protein
MNNYRYFIFGGIGAALILTSCAHRNDIKADESPDASKAVVESPTEKPVLSMSHYIVKKGDCLWSIAAKPSVLGDAFRWPILYKQNRDEIENPDLIEPREDLSYQKHYDSTEIDQAIRQARDWPDYKARVTNTVNPPVKE